MHLQTGFTFTRKIQPGFCQCGCGKKTTKALYATSHQRKRYILVDGGQKQVCSNCHAIKPITEFRKHQRKQGATYSPTCKKCRLKLDNWARNNKHKAQRAVKRTELRNKFAMTLEEYDALLDAQGGVCAICKQADSRGLAVDHCHTTKKNRGLLCFQCNCGIGNFKDNIELLQAAVAYLKRS